MAIVKTGIQGLMLTPPNDCHLVPQRSCGFGGICFLTGRRKTTASVHAKFVMSVDREFRNAIHCDVKRWLVNSLTRPGEFVAIVEADWKIRDAVIFAQHESWSR